MKSFIKWAGSKYRIIEKIKPYFPAAHRLIEPFVGSAAVFLNTTYPSYLLADTNHDLIHLYQYLKKDGRIFINYCRSFFRPEFNDPEAFYHLRSVFNNSNNSRKRAALLLYLNKHCFNGLARFNQKGQFNTPFSPYKQPYFPEKEMLFFYQKAQYVTLLHADFHETLNQVRSGDVVYCDPPYVSLSKTANFNGYTAQGFSPRQQIQLANIAKQLAEQGIPVVISNHDTEFTRHIYQDALLLNFFVQRNISGKNTGRKKVAEILAIFNKSLASKHLPD